LGEATLQGRTALVTGGGRGIGRAVALELAAHGAAVVVDYHRSQDAAEGTVEEITRAGGRAVACGADVADESAVAQLVRTALRHFGALDILVCNAGIVLGQLAALQSLGDWQRTLQVNLTGSFLCIREALPHLIVGGHGSIVCISSRLADRGTGGLAGYSASKGAINALVRSLAVELGRKRIRVNAVAPGLVETDMTSGLPEGTLAQAMDHVPLRRMGRPQEIARVVRFLASDDASYITGEVIGVNGGLAV
jgi:3-oxoacyl-[acyl-carrier protein] reductase